MSSDRDEAQAGLHGAANVVLRLATSIGPLGENRGDAFRSERDHAVELVTQDLDLAGLDEDTRELLAGRIAFVLGGGALVAWLMMQRLNELAGVVPLDTQAWLEDALSRPPEPS